MRNATIYITIQNKIAKHEAMEDEVDMDIVFVILLYGPP